MIDQPIFRKSPLPTDVIAKISGVTYHENADIKLSDLAYLQISHYDFYGEIQVGEMICHKKIASEVLEIFSELFEIKYKIEKIRLPDEYGGDDEKIMGDDNSSCFNYRTIANTNTVSLHGLGRAIDINPLYNPYIVKGKVMPANAQPYADRSADFPHKIDENDECCKIFKNHGWLWGGAWINSKDYQHFYKPESKFKKIINKIKQIK